MRVYYSLLTLLLLIIFSCNEPANKNCSGFITGIIVYPGEGIPSDLIVVAADTLTKKMYSTKKHETIGNDNYFHFSLTVPNGIYFIYAETNENIDTLHRSIKQKGYYTEYTKLEKYKSEGDASHKPIPVIVQCNDTTKNIVVGDFWK